ncbi:DUF928 domain-containing protein [Scytonema sp. PCC 10023]|uniref:DUF928 domain-containing protein n=1 Tax=Scytonema sp. PCC 10023 TaxID=1680591 RepID=UPI0039C5DA62
MRSQRPSGMSFGHAARTQSPAEGDPPAALAHRAGVPPARATGVKMRKMREYFLPRLLHLPLLSLLTLLLSLPLATYAQTSNPRITKQIIQTDNRSKQNRGFQVNIPKKGLPGRRENGGTRRESCMSGELPLLALLLPPTNIGLTTAAYPRFFWYTPKNTAQKVNFTLHKVDETGQRTLVYNTTFQPSRESGVTSLALPSQTIPPLEINQLYQFSVSLICTQDTSPNSVITVYGWVQRVDVSNNLESTLKQLSPKERISVYAQQGLWFDLVSTLADLRACNPSDPTLLATWVSVVKQTALFKAEAIARESTAQRAIAQQPLLQKCSSQSAPASTSK